MTGSTCSVLAGPANTLHVLWWLSTTSCTKAGGHTYLFCSLWSDSLFYYACQC